MELTSQQPRINLPGLIAACPLTLYFLWCAWDPAEWHFIDGADLLIHEAGHIIFMPLGHFLMIAGGSLFQVIMPGAFVVYFYRRRQFFQAALVSFWVGESILNVSVYAADSIKMQLPLIGGSDSIHDWNYLLTETGLLSSTSIVAGLIRLLGTAVIIAAAACAIGLCSKAPSSETFET